MMNPLNTNSAFPKFLDGDVTILVSTNKIYRLHSHTLRQKSPYFEHYLRPEAAPKLTAAARRQGWTPWRFQLYEQLDIEDDIGAFISLQIGETGRPQGNNVAPRAPTISFSGGDGDQCWDWLFGCFYGIKPAFDNSTFAATVNDCVKLVETADTIGAIETVRESVDLALLQQDAILWQSIASNPTVWAELGRRVQSPVIFKEAAVHVIGQWKMLDDDTRKSLPAVIYQLCERKWNELELAKRAIEIRIAGHYPPFLCRQIGDRPHRTTYASDIYTWMALSYFRQYVSQSGTDGKNRTARDGGYAWYKMFATGGDAYLDHDDMQTFHQFFPMSSKACSVMEAHLNVLKDEVKEFVKDLMINRTHIDPEKLEVETPWLTCAVIETADLPWYDAGRSKRERGQDGGPTNREIENDADIEDESE